MHRLACVLFALLLLLAHNAHGSVEQLILTRSGFGGLALTWVSLPPSSPLPSAFAVHYGPRAAPFSLSALPTAAFADPRGLWNGTVLYTPLPGLADDEEYSFAVSDAHTGRPVTPPFTARAPPDPGDDVSLLVAANLGTSLDAVSVEAAMLRTLHALRTSSAPVGGVLLAGDLAFAGNSSSAWDVWGTQLSPLLCSAPLLSAVGCAEFADASAGAYRTRLGNAMPNVSAALPFAYSDDVGAVHVAVLATDGPDVAAQYAWLERDLQRAAEARAAGTTHFIVVMGNAPLFSSNAAANASQGAALRAALLPLLTRYGVDVALWGHVAAYERSVPIALNATSGELLLDTDNATLHLSLGSGGRPPDADWTNPPPQWSVHREAELGFVLLTAFHNHTLHIQFVRVNGTEGDSVWLTRRTAGAKTGAVLVLATVVSMTIIALAIVVVFLLMRRLGHAPAAARYAQLEADTVPTSDDPRPAAA